MGEDIGMMVDDCHRAVLGSGNDEIVDGGTEDNAKDGQKDENAMELDNDGTNVDWLGKGLDNGCPEGRLVDAVVGNGVGFGEGGIFLGINNALGVFIGVDKLKSMAGVCKGRWGGNGKDVGKEARLSLRLAFDNKHFVETTTVLMTTPTMQRIMALTTRGTKNLDFWLCIKFKDWSDSIFDLFSCLLIL